ncbi:MAG: PHP domain-containing protein [Thermoplasmata archaeon]
MLRLDLHVHSKYSPDSSCEVRDILRGATARDLHGVSITDHHSLKGSLKALEMAREEGIILVRGMEVSSRNGHILAYGLEEEIPEGLSAEETVERITESGAFAVAAHPYRFWSGLGEDVIRGARFQGLEVRNARSVVGHNRRSESLALELGLPATAGSDAHATSEIGRAVVLLPDGLDSEEEVLLALRKGLGRTAGVSRDTVRTLRYVAKCVGGWFLRGFKKI